MDFFKQTKFHHQTWLQLKNNSDQTNQEGFVLIATFAILPLLLCICFLIVAFTNYNYVNVHALNLCRKHLLIGQDKIRYQMVKLKQLNPKAKRLRNKHNRALKRVKQSKSPPELAINLVLYAAVIAEQTLFAARQKKHIAIAKAQGLLQVNTLKRKLTQLNNDIVLSVKSFPFMLEAKQKFTLTPDYVEAQHFKERQLVTAKWSLHNYNNIFTNVFIKNAHHDSIEGSCGATIDNQRGVKWLAVLMKKGKL